MLAPDSAQTAGSVIFADDFETGNAAAWSAAVP